MLLILRLVGLLSLVSFTSPLHGNKIDYNYLQYLQKYQRLVLLYRTITKMVVTRRAILGLLVDTDIHWMVEWMFIWFSSLPRNCDWNTTKATSHKHPAPHHILLCLTLLWSSEWVMIWVLPIHTLLDCLLPLIFKMIVHPEYQFWTGQPKSATTTKSTFKHTGSASTWEKVKNTFSRSESPKCQNKQGGCFSFCICAIPVTHSTKLCLSHQQLLLICIKYQNSISYCTFGSETHTNSTFFD